MYDKVINLGSGSGEEVATLVVLHGFMGDCDDFIPLIRQLKDDWQGVNLRVFIPDLLGHGNNEIALPASLGFDDYIHEQWSLWQEYLTPQVAVAGYSMGGRVAMALRVAFPSRVKALFIESAHPGIEDAGKRLRRLASDRKLLAPVLMPTSSNGRRLAFRVFLRKWYSQPLFGKLELMQGFAESLEQKARQDPARLQSALEVLSVGNMPALWSALEKSAPGIFYYLAGSEDEAYLAIGREISRRVQGVHLWEIAAAGHSCHSQNNSAYSQALSSFLQLWTSRK